MLLTLRTGIAAIAFLFAAVGLSAQTGPRKYVTFGLGAQFDLAQLGGTITKDGLEHRAPVRDAQGNLTGSMQRAIYPENTLVSLERSTNGIVSTKGNGAMVGLNLNFGYEKEGLFGNENLFWRVNVNYTTKVAGGYTTSTILGYRWLEQEWNYTAWTIPAYVGIKMFNATRDTGVYIGAGVNYYRGGWGVAGTIDGDALRGLFPGLAGPGGAFLSDAPTPGIWKENAQFRVNGMGLNWLVGAQTKITDKGHLYFELETILSAAMGVAGTQSVGGAAALAPLVAYPVVIGGQTYRVGYKHEL